MSTLDLEGRGRLTEQGLTNEEDLKCTKAFEAFDKDGSGFIDAEEMQAVLEMMGQKQPETTIYHMIQQASPTLDCTISLAQFKQVIGEQKKFQGASQAEDTLDAFVSLGGDQDGSGYIDAQQLIDIIKNDFQMTIDIEQLIKEIDDDGSGQIEFDEFLQLLTSSNADTPAK